MNEDNFKKMKIEELETLADSKKTCLMEARFLLLVILMYLKTSGRWKENKRYTKEGFEKYLWDRHSMRINTLNREYHIFVKFPNEAKEYGPGLINKVVDLCGAKAAPDVLGQIEQARKQNNGVIKSSKIEEIIQRNKRPEIAKVVNRPMPKAAVERSWKEKYEAEVKAHEVTKMRLRASEEENKRKDERIEKLAAAVRKMEEIRAILSGKPRQAEATA